MLHKNNNDLKSVAAQWAEDPQRRLDFACRAGGWHLDYAGLPLSRAQRAQLSETWANPAHRQAVAALFAGQPVNLSEQQPALHMALRARQPDHFADSTEVAAQRERFLNVAEQLFRGQDGIRDVIHLGIGGSDLGPRLVADALDEGQSAVRVHWCATVDGRAMARRLQALDPRHTAVVIASKSFSTEETLVQAEAVKVWMGEHFAAHSWAATANPQRAQAFGVPADRVLAFPSWTGGRFSLWSAVGVSAAAQIGRSAFEALLTGAEQADLAMRAEAEALTPESLAVWLALLMHHLRRGLAHSTLGVVSYSPRLGLLGEYLQQLVMESLGKGVDAQGQPLQAATAPLLLGGRGTDLQHSIFQALHQGMDSHPLLMVACVDDPAADPEWSRLQMAHFLGQARAFTHGRSDGTSHQFMPGQRPAMLLLSPRLTAERLGYLLASFEHAVYALATLWGINPFDQWGVEEGKRLASHYRAQLGAVDGEDLDGILRLLDQP